MTSSSIERPIARGPSAYVAPALVVHERSTRASHAWWSLATSVALGVVFRLWGLSRTNLWLDETASLDLTSLSLRQLSIDLRHSPHGPAYFALVKLWVTVFGTSEAALRSLSVVASVGAIVIGWAIAKRLFGEGAARWTAVLLALSPLQIYFAQEARVYALATCLAAGLVWSYLDRRRGARHVAALAAWCIALLYSYPAASLLFVALWIDGLWRAWRAPTGRRWASLAPWAAAQAIALVAFLPFLVHWNLAAASAGQGWRGSLSAVQAARDLVAYALQEFHGLYVYPVSLPSAWAIVHGAGRAASLWSIRDLVELTVMVPLALVALGFALRAAATRGTRVLWIALVLPVSVAAAASMWHAIELTRYVLFATPFLVLLVARGLTRLPRAGRAPALATLILASLFGIRQYEAVHSRDTDYRPVASYLARAGVPGDTVVIYPWYMISPLRYYYAPGIAFTKYDNGRGGWSVATLTEAGHAAGGGESRWVLLDYRAVEFRRPATSFTHPDERVAQDTLIESGLRLIRVSPAPGP